MKRSRKSRKNLRRGFTLLEVLLVLIILVQSAGFAISAGWFISASSEDGSCCIIN
ncbi:MAG: prepilin-type N-terminal cleavage/methylation domain-containing protein [Pirellula sp.]